MRPTTRTLLVLLLAAGAALAVTALLGSHARANDVFIEGLWDVSTDQSFTGDNITVHGDIWIRDGGSLTLHDCTLAIDSRENDIHTITVNSTGNMYVYNCTIKNRFDYRYFFNVYNDTVFKDTTIEQLFGWDQGPPGGVVIRGGTSHLFDHCTITNSSTYGILTSRPIILDHTQFSWCSWADFAIDTYGQHDDLDFYVRNCTFYGWDQQYFGAGVYAGDSYNGMFKRYLNVSYCTFQYHYYGILLDSAWNNGAMSIDNCYMDTNGYGVVLNINSAQVTMHNNRYKVCDGGIGLYVTQGASGNLTVSHEDIRAGTLNSGTGVSLHGSGHHRLVDVSVWNTNNGVVSDGGTVELRDSYVATASENFYVSGGAEMDIYNTHHKIGSGFVDISGGRITAWQRLNISRVRWSDGTPITNGLVHLLNETDTDIGTIDLSSEWRFLDFKRWEVKKSYSWVNEHVFAAWLDNDTYFRAPELDILVTAPQEIVFTDDYVPRLTAENITAGMYINRNYIALKGGVVERGRGLDRVEATIDGGKHWTFIQVKGERWDTAFSFLPDGVYDVSIRAVDKAGNKAQLDFPGVIVDTHPPFIDLITQIPTATNNPRLHIEGRTEGGATILLGNMVVKPDAAGFFTLDYPLVEGSNGLVLLARDRVGNTNQSVFSVVLDTIPPTLTVISPPDGLITRDAAVFLSGRTDDDATVTVDGDPVSVTRGSFTKAMDLPEGTHDISVRATDAAGNFQDRTITITIDLTPPQLTIDSPAGGRADVPEAAFFITGRTDPDISNVYINGENRTTLPGEFAIEVPLVEGANTFKIAVRDLAGNKNETTVVITKDTTPPTYTIEVTAKNGTITLSGTDRFSSSDTVTLHVSVNEEAVFTIGQVEHRGSGNFIFDVKLDQGRNDIVVQVKDVRNNLAPQFQYTVWYDPTRPTIAIMTPLNGSKTKEATTTVSGATDDGQNMVWVNSVPVSVRTDGTFEIAEPLDWGANTFTIKAKDRAGNEFTHSVSVTREKAEVVQKSPVMGYIVFLVIGLAIGLAVMFARGRGDRPPEEEVARPAPPPPGQQPPQHPPGGWEEM